MPCEGYTNMELPIKEEEISVISGRTFTKILNKLEAKILSVEMRLLHHVVTKLFVPKSDDMTSYLVETFALCTM